MRVTIIPELKFEENERAVLEHAFTPYRVMFNGDDDPDFERVLNRMGDSMRQEHIQEMHRLLIDLREELQVDAERWSKEAAKAPTTPQGLMVNPQHALSMLADTRRRQEANAVIGLETLRRALGVLSPLARECRAMADAAQSAPPEGFEEAS